MRNKFSFAVLSLALCLGACSKYDDTEIRKRADRLEQKISVVENNINSLRTLLEAQKSNAYIKSIIAFTEGNGGYDITLSNGKSIKVYNGANGKNGENGRDGKNGKDGKNGENGRDGRDGIDGRNGENGRDGRDGVDGKNGKDAVASANPISSVDTSNSEYVIFNLRDGGSIRIPRNVSMSFSFDNAEDFAVFAGKKYEIPYTCSALSGKSALKVIAQDGYKAKLFRKSATKGIIELIVPSLAVDTEIIVLLSDGEGATKIYSMSIFAGTLSISSENYLAEKDGATITVPVTTNTNYSIDIAKDAQSWISHTATNLRALNTRNENIEFRVEPNSSKYLRSATIKLKNGDTVLKVFTIIQKGENYAYNTLPGDLENQFHGNIPDRLKIKGKLIKKDFEFLRSNSDKIKILDLSDLDMTELPDSVFMLSSFEEVILPNKLTKIPNICFGYSKIKKVNIPNSVTSIGNSAFSGCTNLSGELIIPNSVTSIGNSAFSGCTNLSGELIIPNSVTSIGGGAFSGCTNLSGELRIPNSVTSIGDGTFSGCTNLSGVLRIPNSVTGIGWSAFSGCTNLSGLSIGNSVTYIGKYAFSGCTNLSGELRIPNSVTTIVDEAFYGCTKLSSLSIGNSVTEIGYSAFSGCTNLSGELIIPNSVTSIGGGAFSNCTNLSSLSIGNSVTSIGGGAFSGCTNLSGELIIPNSVTSIGGDAFSGCTNLSGELRIPNSVTSIGSDAFKDCTKLSSLSIGNSVTEIGYSAFSGCTNLSGVLRIPNSVTRIYRYAFINCKGFSSLIIEGNPQIESSVFLSESKKSLPMINRVYCKSNKVVYFSTNVFGERAFDEDENSNNTKILYIPKGARSRYEEFIHGESSSNWYMIFDEIIEIEESQFP